MANERPALDVRALWQHQLAEGGSMSASEVRRRSEEIQEKARRRVTAIYLIGACNAGLPLILMWFLPELRVGLAYLVLTAIFLVLYVRRRSVFRTVSPTMTAAEGLVFYRHLLERERDFRRDNTRWFTIGPGLNIVALALVYITSPLFHGTAAEIAVIALVMTTHVVVLTRVAQKMRALAQRYQMELEAEGDRAS